MTQERVLAQPNGKLTVDELQEYWSDVSAGFLAADPDGLAVICYAGMPKWFNGFLDRYQRMAISRLTRGVDLHGCKVLDIGTGVGRWAHWFIGQGAARVVGVDIEPERLSVARHRARGMDIQFEQMSIDGLTFPSGSFDIVNSVTVLQHVPHDVKVRTLAEISRVLRPNGYLILFELTDMSDDAPHVFPETRESWEQLCSAEGLHVEGTVGDQYTPLIRLAKAAFDRTQIDRLKSEVTRARAIQPASLALKALVLLSYPVEEVCQRIAPPSAAKITGFLLRKQAANKDGVTR